MIDDSTFGLLLLWLAGIVFGFGMGRQYENKKVFQKLERLLES